MKRLVLISVPLALVTLFSRGQPTITYNGNAPQIGDIYYVHNTEDDLDPGPSGANQTWDFSVINVTSSDELLIMNPSSTPFVSEFPESNQVSHFDGTTTYNYNNVNPSKMEHNGDGFEGNPPLIIHYTNPSTQMIFPFSYNNSSNDTYYSEYTQSGMTMHSHGTVTLMADAWGTVTTPEGTFSNVLRTRNHIVQVDSAFMEGIFLYTTTSTFTHYNWHTANSHHPVMSISILSTSLMDDIIGSYTSNTQGIPSRISSINKIELYPNPSYGTINLSCDVGSPTVIDLSVYNSLGQKLFSLNNQVLPFGNLQMSIDLSCLKQGMYLLEIKNKEGILTEKFLKR
jgi:hypothetical protein